MPGFGLSTGEVTTYTNQTLLDESSSSVEYTRSFRCAALNNITGFSPFTTNHSINLTLAVDDLQVQAFEFRNATSGEFDNGVCLELFSLLLYSTAQHV